MDILEVLKLVNLLLFSLINWLFKFTLISTLIEFGAKEANENEYNNYPAQNVLMNRKSGLVIKETRPKAYQSKI